MTTGLAEIFKSIIIDAAPVFIDRVEGLVKMESEMVNDANGKPVKSWFPVACIANPENCTDDERKVIPDEKYRSIIYFEEASAPNVLSFDGHGETVWEATLRLVCWINMAKFTITGCSLSAPFIQNLISILPNGQAFNTSPYLKIQVKGIRTIKNASIFSVYSYNEDVTKYMTFPYDYFAMDITVRWILHNSCKELITLNDNECIV